MDDLLTQFKPPSWSIIEARTQELGRVLLSRAQAEQDLAIAQRQLELRTAMLTQEEGDGVGKDNKNKLSFQLIKALSEDVEAGALATRAENCKREIGIAKAREGQLDRMLVAAAAYAGLVASIIDAQSRAENRRSN